MTTAEQKSVDKLYQLLSEIKSENSKHREEVNSKVQSISERTDKKHLPIHLEQDILKSAQKAVHESISKVLTDYNSPLVKLVRAVVDENSAKLRSIISDSFTEVIDKGEFKQSIVSAFSHKVSRAIISNNDGLFDKVSNELKQDTVFKSKMALAVSNVVDECLREKSTAPSDYDKTRM